MEVANKVPGKLQLHINARSRTDLLPNKNSIDFRNIKKLFPNLVYLTIISDPSARHDWIVSKIKDIKSCPNMVIACQDCLGEHRITVEYRPALLNGRYVMNVLRDITTGSSDVDEMYLGRYKWMPTTDPEDKGRGVWFTKMTHTARLLRELTQKDIDEDESDEYQEDEDWSYEDVSDEYNFDGYRSDEGEGDENDLLLPSTNGTEDESDGDEVTENESNEDEADDEVLVNNGVSQ